MNTQPQSANTPPFEPDFPRWSEQLCDRSHVVTRPIGTFDEEAVRAFMECLSARSRCFRILGQTASSGKRMIEQVTDINYRQQKLETVS